MVHLPLVRRTTAVPEEDPLQALVALELILETEDVLLVGKLQKIEQLGGCFHDWERWRHVIVDDDRNPT